MKTASFFLIAVLTSCMFAPGVHSAEAVKSEPVASASVADKDAALYSEGTRAINEGRWSDAAGLFNKVVQQHGPRAARRGHGHHLLVECALAVQVGCKEPVRHAADSTQRRRSHKTP